MTSTLKIVGDEVASFAYELDRVHDLKVVAEEAKQAFEKAQADLIALMDDQELFEVDTPEWHATKVAGQTLTVDDKGLISWATQNRPEIWSRITKTVIDRAKLGEVIGEDEIPMEVVNQYMTTKPKKSYLLITERKIDPDAQ